MKIELSNGLEVKAVKAEHGKLAPLQRSHLDKILTSGGAVTVLRPSEFDGFKKFVEEVLNND